ncbi:MAG: hypothetical protein COA79_16970 [Planctomycetota bacterium]|nr:MAG: hypothetical protein COA79_16970 [Planctomycetota bacterium]
MSNSGRFMQSREPRQRSFFLSFLFFFCLLGLFILIANVTNGGLRNSWNELFEVDQKVRAVVRQNKNQLSLERFNQNLPDQFLAMGVFSSGEGSFYHEFLSLSNRYKKIKKIEFALVNIDVFGDKESIDKLIIEKKMLSINRENLPSVIFFYNGVEISNERLSAKFSNLIQNSCVQKIKRLFKLDFNKKTKEVQGKEK